MTTDPQTADDPLAVARATNQRLNARAQRLESELAAYRRAVAQWEINERGTYIPHASLRAIGLASGRDILGSVRHLKHFERVEQAEAAVERVRRLHDSLAAETDLTSPDDEITRGAAARKIAAALDGHTPAVPVAAPPTTEQTAAARCAVCRRTGDGSHPAVCFPPAPAGRAAEARVRALHQEYAFGDDPQVYCAHCNQISGGWIPWPCPTVQALAAEAPHAETPDAVVARVLAVAEVIEANGIGWAADSVRRACRGDAEQPRTCAHCGQIHDSSSLTHFGAPGGPWYCVDRDDCRGAGGLPPRKPAAAPAVSSRPGTEQEA